MIALLLFAAWFTIGLVGLAATIESVMDSSGVAVPYLFGTIVWFGLPFAVALQ